MSKTLDTQFKGPLGLRFGWDALLGLIPGVGDFFTTATSFYIIYQAAHLGASSSTLIRMALNVAIENVLEVIPVIGNIFDFYWKSNNRNIQLLENHLKQPTRETIKSRMILALIFMIFMIILFIAFYTSYILFKSVYYWITS